MSANNAHLTVQQDEVIHPNSSIAVPGPAHSRSVELSLTVAQRGRHLDMRFVPKVAAWLHLYAKKAFFSIEEGKHASHVHLQGVICLQWDLSLSDTRERKLLVDHFKRFIGTRVGERVMVTLKALQAGQTWTELLGYCQKDRNRANFRGYFLNIDNASLLTGQAEYRLVFVGADHLSALSY